jgi:hypothetical protein
LRGGRFDSGGSAPILRPNWVKKEVTSIGV